MSETITISLSYRDVIQLMRGLPVARDTVVIEVEWRDRAKLQDIYMHWIQKQP